MSVVFESYNTMEENGGKNENFHHINLNTYFYIIYFI